MVGDARWAAVVVTEDSDGAEGRGSRWAVGGAPWCAGGKWGSGPGRCLSVRTAGRQSEARRVRGEMGIGTPCEFGGCRIRYPVPRRHVLSGRIHIPTSLTQPDAESETPFARIHELVS